MEVKSGGWDLRFTVGVGGIGRELAPLTRETERPSATAALGTTCTAAAEAAAGPDDISDTPEAAAAAPAGVTRMNDDINKPLQKHLD